MSGRRAKRSRKAEALRNLKSESAPPSPWRMIATRVKAEEVAHLIVPSPRARSKREAYMLVACGKGWLLRAVGRFDEPSEFDAKCPACLASFKGLKVND